MYIHYYIRRSVPKVFFVNSKVIVKLRTCCFKAVHLRNCKCFYESPFSFKCICLRLKKFGLFCGIKHMIFMKAVSCKKKQCPLLIIGIPALYSWLSLFFEFVQKFNCMNPIKIFGRKSYVWIAFTMSLFFHIWR